MQEKTLANGKHYNVNQICTLNGCTSVLSNDNYNLFSIPNQSPPESSLADLAQLPAAPATFGSGTM
ncbi:hypothetical protein K443DRAFT_225678 [Laccaria amethystina LaAM-08-1]|uniref:Uncharacterized protein n=1 Tax=Laccaria amethystina LaAM-08-1 TaxID=1095629 RepID=A0A0C9XJZ4_9AGAR|nr:hypothetical protein K443DRAFT_225678 [Laccaria amethystina LaAM-08-1]